MGDYIFSKPLLSKIRFIKWFGLHFSEKMERVIDFISQRNKKKLLKLIMRLPVFLALVHQFLNNLCVVFKEPWNGGGFYKY